MGGFARRQLGRFRLGVKSGRPGIKLAANNETPGRTTTLCYTIVLQGWKPGFRAEFHPYDVQESLQMGIPAGRAEGRPAGLILRLSRLGSGRNPARKPDFRPGSTIA